MSRACRPGLPNSWRRADRGRMPEIPPALEAAMDEYARKAVDESPPLTEEQVRQLRAALRRDAWDSAFIRGEDPGPEPGAS